MCLGYNKTVSLCNFEHDLAHYALQYKTTWEDSFMMEPLYCAYYNHKEKIALLCSLIKKYNDARGSKVTLTSDDWRCYLMVRNINVLYNNNHLACKEYEQLREDIINLQRTSDKFVKECCALKYPINLSDNSKYQI